MREMILAHRRIVEAAILLGLLLAIISSDAIHGFVAGLIEQAAVVIRGHPLAGALVFIDVPALPGCIGFTTEFTEDTETHRGDVLCVSLWTLCPLW